MDNSPLEAEVEALRYTYTDDELQIFQGEPLCVVVKLAPRLSNEVNQEFVRVTLHLQAGSDYPNKPASVALSDSKGLSECSLAQLLEGVRHEASSMLGELMLGHLCETATSLLTDVNRPEGDCPVCLEPLNETHLDMTPYTVQRLPCYHCLHRSCFASWFSAEQASKREKYSQLLKAIKHAVDDQKLEESGLKPGSNGLFTLLCPICRVPMPLQQFTKTELRKLREEDSLNKSSSASKPLVLSDETKQRLKLMQQKHKAIFASQLERGGIVPASYAVALRWFSRSQY